MPSPGASSLIGKARFRQWQRLCLDRLLALEPEILLLDEPTASLDFRAPLKVEELLLSLNIPARVEGALQEAHL